MLRIISLTDGLQAQTTAASSLLDSMFAYHANRFGVLRLQEKCHPQTIAVCQTRAEGLGLTVKVHDQCT